MKTGHLARLFRVVNEKYTAEGNKKNITTRSGRLPLFTTDKQVFRQVRVGFIIAMLLFLSIYFNHRK